MSRIKRLPEDVHNSVRSTVVICDLARVVEELVFNSLEAGATKVFGAVGVGSCYVKVVDNGSGITRDELVLLGERYATSKVDHMVVTNTECFDFRGEALCSISHVSLLEIVTKARGKLNGYKKIMKDCKCLFLGINDDIQDVGTTVTARDIFYNQPVRRKHMESSPKKVLDSIKMSVLRIALVHVNVSFKVVDVESTSELLYTMASSSPLPILSSNFGIENPSEFYKLDISNGALKLSGYISGPRESFSLKAIQYVYINSRFIGKGPIHKLLNQLADKFDLLNTGKPTNGSQREKQNKCHMCPTFILNVNCPRSYYDIVTSELSRTAVEFKDWDSVLSFIESGVKHLWIENISHDMPATSESGRKRRREKNCQTSLDLSSSQVKRPSRSYENSPPWEDYLRTQQKQSAYSELKNHQNETLFSLDTDYKSQSCDGSLASDRVIRNALISSNIPPCSVSSPERHQFMACKSGKKEDNIPASPSVDVLPTFEDDITVSSGIFTGYLEFRDDISVNHEMKKPSLRSCSSPRSFHDTTRAPSDERSEFGMHDFRVTKRWIDCDDSIIDEAGQLIGGREIQNDGLPPFQLSPIIQDGIHDITVSSGMSAGYFEFRDDIPINHDMKKSSLRSCSFPRSFHGTTRAASDGKSKFGMDDFRVTKRWTDCDDTIVDEAGQIICGREIQNDELPPYLLSPAIQYDIHDRLEFPRVDLAKSSLASRNIQTYSSELVQKRSSSHQYFGPECCPITEEQSATIRFQEDDVSYRNMDDSQSEFGKESIHSYTWREDVSVDSNLSREESWQRQNSSIMNFSPFAKGRTYRKSGIAEFLLDDFENSLSPNPSKRLSEKGSLYMFSDDEETLNTISRPSLYGNTSMLHGSGRPNRRGAMCNRRKSSIRSHSAPPFHKGKKRFLDLSDSSTILSAKSNTRIISRTLCGTEPVNLNRTQPHAEASYTKYLQKSNDHYQPSRMDRSDADCSFAQRQSLGKTPEVGTTLSGRSKQRDQIINRKYEQSTNLKEIQDSLNSGGKWRSSLPAASGPAPFINKDQDTILAISSDILYLSGDSLVPKSIDKTLLDSAKVLNQVDKKFIAVVAGKVLAVIDQHAADERIRLEELRQKVLSGEMKTITYLEDEKELVLPEVGYQLLHNYAEQIQAWGWICNIHSHDASSFTKNLDFLHRQPSVVKLVAVPCILGVNLTDIDLLEFLQQLADTDGSSTIPPSVHHILNNKACRGAIMFGDTLLPSECSLVVEELKRTSLCFQCAHGRPTTVPLVNLGVLHNNIAKLGSHESWHGLRQHKISLERSLQRLRSAEC